MYEMTFEFGAESQYDEFVTLHPGITFGSLQQGGGDHWFCIGQAADSEVLLAAAENPQEAETLRLVG